MTRAEWNEKRLALLEIIKDKKDILFSLAKNDSSMKKQKEEIWQEILLKAKSLGMVSPNRQWTFVRDNLFGLWKSRALAKRNNVLKSGNKWKKESKLDGVDEVILDIVGIELPTPNIMDMSLPKGKGATIQNSNPKLNSKIKQNLKPIDVSNTAQLENCFLRKRKTCETEDDQIILLKKKLLNIEIYTAKLEALKLERQLGISSSKFTKGLELDDNEDSCFSDEYVPSWEIKEE